MSDLYWLTDEQMARRQLFFRRSHGRPRVDDRRVLSGIIFVNRSGLRWRDALRDYGLAKTLCNRWKRWSGSLAGWSAQSRLAAGRPRLRCRLVPRCPRGEGDYTLHPGSKATEQARQIRQAPIQRPQQDRDHVRSSQRPEARRNTRTTAARPSCYLPSRSPPPSCSGSKP